MIFSYNKSHNLSSIPTKDFEWLLKKIKKNFTLEEKHKTLWKTSTTEHMFYFQIKAHSFLLNFINKIKQITFKMNKHY